MSINLFKFNFMHTSQNAQTIQVKPYNYTTVLFDDLLDYLIYQTTCGKI